MYVYNALINFTTNFQGPCCDEPTQRCYSGRVGLISPLQHLDLVPTTGQIYYLLLHFKLTYSGAQISLMNAFINQAEGTYSELPTTMIY